MTLFVAVPAAAIAGMVVLGVLALVVALLISSVGDFFDFDFGDRRRKTRARKR